MTPRNPDALVLTRRVWLAGLTLAALGGRPAWSAPGGLKADPGEVEAIVKRAAEAKLDDFQASESEHFIGLGNAPESFREEALGVCELVYKTYRNHFQTIKKLEVTAPPNKMAVVILADRKSYEAFKGEPVDGSDVGHYDIDANRLVTYDFSGGKVRAAANRELNTFTLVHETTHQLTYNTGLLARQADVPVAVSEGFATYCEVWRKSRPVVGKVNHPWLGVLKPAGVVKDWIPVSKLLTDDDLFRDPDTAQLAYAECWLLTYDLLQTPAGTKMLRAYLADLRKQRDPSRRLIAAEGAFGRLDRLDAELKRTAERLR